MPSYSVSAEVAATPEAVWRVLSDVEGMPGWTSSMASVRIVEGPNPPDAGTAVRIEQPGLLEGRRKDVVQEIAVHARS